MKKKVFRVVHPNPVDAMDHKMCTWQSDANDLEQKHAWGLFVEKEGCPPEMTVRTPWRDYRLRARSQEVVRKCHAALVRAGVPTFCGGASASPVRSITPE